MLNVFVARTLDHFAKAVAVRAAVYMNQQQCPYEEEFDGNDFSGSLLLASADREPAGTIRVRYFAEFVKFERLAVLSQFRDMGVARALIETAISLCARKGFTRAYLHAQERLETFWQQFGFKRLASNRDLIFSDHRYIEMKAQLASTKAITLATSPLTIIRPEGDWDIPGILDQSASRKATNPH